MIARIRTLYDKALWLMFRKQPRLYTYEQWTPEEIAHLMDKGRAPVVIHGIDWGAVATSSTGAECQMKRDAAEAHWHEVMAKMRLKAVDLTGDAAEVFEREYLLSPSPDSTPLEPTGKNGPNSRQFE